jgi:hypothetical protein
MRLANFDGLADGCGRFAGQPDNVVAVDHQAELFAVGGESLGRAVEPTRPQPAITPPAILSDQAGCCETAPTDAEVVRSPLESVLDSCGSWSVAPPRLHEVNSVGRLSARTLAENSRCSSCCFRYSPRLRTKGGPSTNLWSSTRPTSTPQRHKYSGRIAGPAFGPDGAHRAFLPGDLAQIQFASVAAAHPESEFSVEQPYPGEAELIGCW